MLKIVSLVIALLGISAAALAEVAPLNTREPVVLTADRVSYDQTKDIATASGQVEVAQGDKLLRADSIIYDKKRDVVLATGNVKIIDNTGQVSFADRAEITSDFKQGFVERISLLLADNSRFAAQEGERVDGRYVLLRRAVYSACDLCKDDPKKPPLWQLKAAKVTHDNESKRIRYRDVFLELGGIPVFYTPYFSHPDPSVKRKTGFLTPQGGRSSNIGNFITVPYYIDLAPDKDLTLSPTFSGKDGVQMAGQYRQRFVHGAMQFDASAVVADRVNEQNVVEPGQLRGHVFGNVGFDLSPAHRVGAKIAFTSDKTYLYRYRIPTDDVLENRAYLERFRGRDYFGAEGFYFQDLRPGDRQVEPVVLRARYAALGEPNQTLGGRWEMNAEAVALTRDSTVNTATEGPDSRRASLSFGWERQLVSELGLVASVAGHVRGDVFFADRLRDPNDPNNRYRQAFSERVLPLANVTLRYPLGRQGEHWRQSLEPILAFTAAPNKRNEPRIANEDSQGTEYDATNLFAYNRFSGVDRYETGARVTYGVRAGAYSDAGGRYDAMIGSSYRLSRNSDFLASSGLREQQADIVGYMYADPVSWLGARYNFRLNKDTLQPRYSQLDAFAGAAWFRPTVQYLAVDGLDSNNNEGTVSEVTYGFSTNFMPYWTFAAAQRRALRSDPGPRSTTAVLRYQDECSTFALSVNRDQISRPDLNSGTSFMLTVFLRNLGQLQTDSISTGLGDRREVTQR
jgi:LPS-assembly protein